MSQGVPIVNGQNPKPKSPSCWTVGCGFWIIILVISMFAIPRDKNGNVVEKTKTKQEIKLEKVKQAEVNKRFTAINKIITDAGGQMEVSNVTISITLPGAVSEYEAERVAKMVSDRTGTFHVVRVYDNAGLLRARL